MSTAPTSDGAAPASSTIEKFDDLARWYATNAAKARLRHQVLEVSLLVVGALVAVVALAFPGNGVPAAVLGAVVVILTGLRQLFHWQENYVRFTDAWRSLKQERLRYEVLEPPYDDPALRNRKLIEFMNDVEGRETTGWAALMESKGKDAAA